MEIILNYLFFDNSHKVILKIVLEIQKLSNFYQNRNLKIFEEVPIGDASIRGVVSRTLNESLAD